MENASGQVAEQPQVYVCSRTMRPIGWRPDRAEARPHGPDRDAAIQPTTKPVVDRRAPGRVSGQISGETSTRLGTNAIESAAGTSERQRDRRDREGNRRTASAPAFERHYRVPELAAL